MIPDKKYQKAIIALSVIGIIILGFFREFIFVNINEQLFALWYEEDSRASDWIPFLKTIDYWPLYYSKWVLTIVFSGLFYLSINIILKLIFQRSYWKEIGLVYITLLLGAGIAVGIGYAFGVIEQTYIFARFLMGIAQSPILLMIMVPGIWLRRNRQTA